jgi:hypothetical protein
MTTTTSAELSLINDAEFLEQLEGCDRVSGHGPDGLSEPRPMSDAAFDALETGLPMDAGARAINEPFQPQRPAPAADVYDDEPIARQPPERQIPFLVAALVIVACLTAGAATAAVVFHDRLTAITATATASR